MFACANLWSWFLSIDKGKTVINLLDHRPPWFEVPDIVIIIIIVTVIVIIVIVIIIIVMIIIIKSNKNQS